jgi:oxalate decarboxylase/phosphoglucose isomerase-like protein (cupin superfamily)
MINQWHRRFAVACNNHTWDLIEKPERTPAEDQEMLNNAYASIFHWSKVGTALHMARGEVNLAHVHALRGEGELALRYAQK